jgi:L-histidine N-alpha-methyltransferase
VVGGHNTAFELLDKISPGFGVFLGSSIGNFTKHAERDFFDALSRLLGQGGYFLLGVDLVKDPAVLECAYNDTAKVTEAFIRNIFVRIQNEVDANISLDGFRYEARYNRLSEQMEISASFDNGLTVNIPNSERTVKVAPGRRIRVEICRKYRLSTLTSCLKTHGIEVVAAFTDDKQWFADLLLKASTD